MYYINYIRDSISTVYQAFSPPCFSIIQPSDSLLADWLPEGLLNSGLFNHRPGNSWISFNSWGDGEETDWHLGTVADAVLKNKAVFVSFPLFTKQLRYAHLKTRGQLKEPIGIIT